MPFIDARSRIEEMFVRGEESFDLEAIGQTEHSLVSAPPFTTRSGTFPQKAKASTLTYKIFRYPSPGSVVLRSTSWLDGVRGVAAMAVYLFHTIGCWASLNAAWHSGDGQGHILQMPVLRTLFVSGGTAVSVFFVLSGYVLTHKCLGWIREGSTHQVYPAVASSMFRRGFRLYLPPTLLTFFAMLATRFGYPPALNFEFVAETSLFSQFVDWLAATAAFIDPIGNFQPAMQGFIIHHKYDPVVWTIPLELYGSFLCYILLLALARIPSTRARMGFVAVFACFCMRLGSWNMFCFSAGILIADLNLIQENTNIATSTQFSWRVIIWPAVFALAFYLSGFPTFPVEDTVLKPMPGFETLRSLTPMTLNLQDHSRFWWSISGVLALLSISQISQLKSLFTNNFYQYLGKISFSLYLLHQFCLMVFGLSMQAFLMNSANLEPHANTFTYWVVCGIWYILFTLPVFALAAQFERWVDEPSVRFAKWLEKKLIKHVEIYRR